MNGFQLLYNIKSILPSKVSWRKCEGDRETKSKSLELKWNFCFWMFFVLLLKQRCTAWNTVSLVAYFCSWACLSFLYIRLFLLALAFGLFAINLFFIGPFISILLLFLFTSLCFSSFLICFSFSPSSLSYRYFP